jgi:hypothetical protein
VEQSYTYALQIVITSIEDCEIRAPVVMTTSIVVDEIVKNLDMYMLVGVIAIVAISQFERKIGSILGIFFWASVAFFGHQSFSMGGGVGIGDKHLPPGIFYGICFLLMAVNIGNGFFVVRRKRRALSEANQPLSED